MLELEDYDLEALAYEEAVLEEINQKDEVKAFYYGDDAGRAE